MLLSSSKRLTQANSCGGGLSAPQNSKKINSKVKALFKTLLASHLLRTLWPKQDMWPTQKQGVEKQTPPLLITVELLKACIQEGEKLGVLWQSTIGTTEEGWLVKLTSF